MDSSLLSPVPPSSFPQIPVYFQRRLPGNQTIIPPLASEQSSLSATLSHITPRQGNDKASDDEVDDQEGEDNEGDSHLESSQESNFGGFPNDENNHNVNNSLGSGQVQSATEPLEGIVEATQRLWRQRRRRYKPYTFRAFLEGWLLGKSGNGRDYRSGPRAREMVRALRSPTIRDRLGELGVRLHFEDEVADVAYVKDLRRELSALAAKPTFSKFDRMFPTSTGDTLPTSTGDTPCATREVCSTDWISNALEDAWGQIQEAAPKLSAFLASMLSHQRSNRKSYTKTLKTTEFKHPAKAYLIASVVLGTYGPKTCNFLPLTMGIYLHSCGVPRRAMDTLAQLGVCAGYRSILKQLEEMSSPARARVVRSGFVTELADGRE